MNIFQVRKFVYSKIGCRVVVIYNIGRNRKEKYFGVLYQAYNNVFLLKLSNGAVKCFNYKDILTKTIQLYT